MALKNFLDLVSGFFKKLGKICSRYSDSILEYSRPFNRTASGNLNGFDKRKLYFRLSEIITFLIIYSMLFYCFPPHLLFNNTTTNGGDMGAHNYLAKFFVDNLFPSFRMTGWDMGWFAGMPMFTFYFPLPFFFIALISKITTFNIAFKLIAVLGSLILPVTVYSGAKLFRFKYPYPLLAATGSMVFLYMKSYKIYGGNFLGTFAGEFSYSISFGLIFLFIATLYKGMEKQRFDWLFAINAIILACIVLTHLITLIAVIIIAPSLLLINRGIKSARYILAVFALGFFLSAFWSLPFVLLIKWTPEMHWTSIKNIKELIPLELIPALVFAACGMYFYITKRDKRLIPAVWSLIIFLIMFFAIDSGRLYNARFLPFIFISIYILAAYGIANLYWVLVSLYPKIKFRSVGRSKIFKNDNIPHQDQPADINEATAGCGKDYIHDTDTGEITNARSNNSPGESNIKSKSRNPKFKKNFIITIVFFFVPVLAFIASGAIMAGNPLGPAWARHNFTGFEQKDDWETYDSLMEYLDSLPYGRVMFEFDKTIIQKYGTPRSFELIPFWTDQAGMEGLLVESSLSAPFHYINQAELSVKPRGTVAGWKVPSRNYEAAMKHLKYFNISYIMASSEDVVYDLDRDSSVVFLNKIDPWYFYEIRQRHSYVEILDNMPYRYRPVENWVWDMRDWYLNADNTDNPVIFDDGSKFVSRFDEISRDELPDVAPNPLGQPKGVILSENVEREKIEFETTGIGQPHLIKVSYFPNWHAVGAEGPYLVAPSLMLVFPTQSKVTLYYGMTYANRIGVVLSVSGWIIIAGVIIYNIYLSRFFRYFRRRRP